MEQGKRVTLRKARRLIQDLNDDCDGPLLYLPVPSTSRLVGVQHWGPQGMGISTFHPADIISSQVLTTWANKTLPDLSLYTDRLSGLHPKLPPPVPTMEEWGDLLHHLPDHAPPMTGSGELLMYHYKQTSSSYDELLAALPAAFPHLIRMKGLRLLRMWEGKVSRRQLLAFLGSLNDNKYKLTPDKDPYGYTCTRLEKDGYQLKVQLFRTTVTGGAGVLEEVRARSEKTGILYRPEWRED